MTDKLIMWNCKNLNFNNVSVLLLLTFMNRFAITMIATHFKCRGGLYPRSNIERLNVPDDKVSWSVDFLDYKPPNHTAASIIGKPWADLDIGDPNFEPKWNSLDGNASRISYMGTYIIKDGYPLNIIGRTGITGRGILGRWGPNHAADPVVTRWKRTNSGMIAVDKDKKQILQFVAIKRGDTGEWALPGGMVDPGEKVTTTAIREFREEAINSLEMSEEEIKVWEKKFEQFFNEGEVVYEGYIDDRRNTDNAWMESVAYNFHDEDGSTVGKLKLHAGDDAVGVRWIDITPELILYASHQQIVMEVLKRRLERVDQNHS